MKWLQRLWAWLTEGPAIEPDPAERRSVAISPPYISVRVDDLTHVVPARQDDVDEPGRLLSRESAADEWKPIRLPANPPIAPKPPQKPRKRRIRKHK